MLATGDEESGTKSKPPPPPLRSGPPSVSERLWNSSQQSKGRRDRAHKSVIRAVVSNLCPSWAEWFRPRSAISLGSHSLNHPGLTDALFEHLALRRAAAPGFISLHDAMV